MARLCSWLIVFCALCQAGNAIAAAGRIVKVLPEFLDLKGRNSLSPSLYERDVYQAMLREHPERRSTLRFYIQWKTKGPVWQPLTVRVEMRGIAEGNLPKQLVLAQPVENPGGPLSHWTSVTLSSNDYKRIGSVTAWRVTFWEGKTLLGQEHS